MKLSIPAPPCFGGRARIASSFGSQPQPGRSGTTKCPKEPPALPSVPSGPACAGLDSSMQAPTGSLLVIQGPSGQRKSTWRGLGLGRGVIHEFAAISPEAAAWSTVGPRTLAQRACCRGRTVLGAFRGTTPADRSGAGHRTAPATALRRCRQPEPAESTVRGPRRTAKDPGSGPSAGVDGRSTGDDAGSCAGNQNAQRNRRSPFRPIARHASIPFDSPVQAPAGSVVVRGPSGQDQQ